MPKKRIFIALPVSEELQEKVHTWQHAHAELSRLLSSSRRSTEGTTDRQVRWVRGSNLHITLVPPIWVEEGPKAPGARAGSQLEKLIEKLNGVSGKPFHLQFTKIEFGPKPRNPRLIWAYGNEKPPEDGIELKERLEQAADHKSTYKNWFPHLTIARFRPEEFKKFPVRQLNEHVDWEEQFDSFVLMQSHLKGSGAEYEILERFPFKIGKQ